MSRPQWLARYASISLEQLLAINPTWLLVAHYRQESIVKNWQQDPLWQIPTAANSRSRRSTVTPGRE
jgi:iron complex transport system substrate-binding protein